MQQVKQEDTVFTNDFINQCEIKIQEYNASRDRGFLFKLFSAVSSTRQLPQLGAQLRSITNAKECFDLLVFLVRTKQAVNAPGFSALVLDLLKSICQELKDKNNKIFDQLSPQCDQCRSDYDARYDGFDDYTVPSLDKIKEIERVLDQCVDNRKLTP